MTCALHSEPDGPPKTTPSNLPRILPWQGRWLARGQTEGCGGRKSSLN